MLCIVGNVECGTCMPTNCFVRFALKFNRDESFEQPLRVGWAGCHAVKWCMTCRVINGLCEGNQDLAGEQADCLELSFGLGLFKESPHFLQVSVETMPPRGFLKHPRWGGTNPSPNAVDERLKEARHIFPP